MSDPLIIAPCHGRRHPGTQKLLEILHWKHGWDILDFFGAIGVDRLRSQAASIALQYPQRSYFWCDDDNFLPVTDVLDMWSTFRAQDLDCLAAVVPVRRARPVPNFNPLSNDQAINLGSQGGIYEVKSCGLALAFTSRRLFEVLSVKGPWIDCQCPHCGKQVEKTLPPVDYTMAYTDENIEGRAFCLPIVNEQARAHYGEDYSFCERVRKAGMKLHVDTRKVAMHEDKTLLSLEDIAKDFHAREAAAAEKAAREAEWF